MYVALKEALGEIPPQVWVAIITALGTVFAAILKFINDKHTKILEEGKKAIEASADAVNQVTNELKLQESALGFHELIFHWTDIGAEVESLIENTPIDRFLMLRAWNGTLDPKWTSAFFQMRKSEMGILQYVHYPLDDDYVQRLKTIRSKGSIYTTTEDMYPGGLKDIYEAEGVTASYLTHLIDIPIDDRSTAIMYCSFATIDGEIDKDCRTKCDILVGRLQHIIRNYHNSDRAGGITEGTAVKRV